MMRKGSWWPVAVTAALVTVVVVNIGVMRVAGGDPSFVIEPDYYRKAVSWDSSMAQAERNVALGWTVAAHLNDFSRDSGALLTVKVSDSAATPVQNAHISVSALFNARASVIDTTEMKGVDGNGGTYSAVLPIDRNGQWELRFVVTRGAEYFTSNVRVEARPAR